MKRSERVIRWILYILACCASGVANRYINPDNQFFSIIFCLVSTFVSFFVFIFPVFRSDK